MSSGVSRPFLVLCHRAAMSGKRARSEVVAVGTLPAQLGHRAPFVRERTSACQTCEGLLEQRHRTLRALPGTTSFGVRAPFFLGSHSAAIAGNTAPSDR